MQALARLRSRGRRRIGRAAHGAGVATRADIRHLASEQAALVSQAADLTSLLQRVAAAVDALHVTQQELDGRLGILERAAAIQSFARFIEHAELKSRPLVSVVLPTRDRPKLLRRALASVLTQRYEEWELLVVDDGGIETSREIIDALEDPRIRWMQSGQRGASAARNVALGVARGELIAYLDDDNLMDPGWLYSVVWALEHHPEIDVLYGGFVIDDPLRVKGQSRGGLPTSYLHPWDHELLRRTNLADIGAIAHRSGLPEARFDESLVTLGDWDLLLRLTADTDPLVLPAIACYYMTDAPIRLTGGPTESADTDEVRRRAAMITR